MYKFNTTKIVIIPSNTEWVFKFLRILHINVDINLSLLYNEKVRNCFKKTFSTYEIRTWLYFLVLLNIIYRSFKTNLLYNYYYMFIGIEMVKNKELITGPRKKLDHLGLQLGRWARLTSIRTPKIYGAPKFVPLMIYIHVLCDCTHIFLNEKSNWVRIHLKLVICSTFKWIFCIISYKRETFLYSISLKRPYYQFSPEHR